MQNVGMKQNETAYPFHTNETDYPFHTNFNQAINQSIKQEHSLVVYVNFRFSLVEIQTAPRHTFASTAGGHNDDVVVIVTTIFVIIVVVVVVDANDIILGIVIMIRALIDFVGLDVDGL